MGKRRRNNRQQELPINNKYCSEQINEQHKLLHELIKRTDSYLNYFDRGSMVEKYHSQEAIDRYLLKDPRYITDMKSIAILEKNIRILTRRKLKEIYKPQSKDGAEEVKNMSEEQAMAVEDIPAAEETVVETVTAPVEEIAKEMAQESTVEPVVEAIEETTEDSVEPEVTEAVAPVRPEDPLKALKYDLKQERAAYKIIREEYADLGERLRANVAAKKESRDTQQALLAKIAELKK